MRSVSVFILTLFVGLSTIGCDSNEDGLSDAELFVGTWGLVSITDGGGDKTPLLLAVANSLIAQLNENKTLSVAIDYKQQAALNLDGVYTVNEGSKQLTMTVDQQSASFNYSFSNDNQVTLSAPSEIVNGLFATTIYSGTVSITIQRAS